MNSYFRALFSIVLSFCVLNLQIVPVAENLRQAREAQAKVFANYHIQFNSSHAEDKPKLDPCSAADKDKVRAGTCVNGKFEDDTGTYAYVEPYVSMILILASAVATMLMIKGCVMSKSCGWAALFAAVAAVALLGGEIAMVVANKKVLTEIGYSVTALKKNGNKCATGEDGSGVGTGTGTLTEEEKKSGVVDGQNICEQSAALNAQKEAYESIATGLLIKGILYAAAAASYTIAMIIELAANSAWITEAEAIYASSKIAIAACHTACAGQAGATLGAGGAVCLAQNEPCMAMMIADEANIRAIQNWVMARPPVGPSLIACTELNSLIAPICPTAVAGAVCGPPAIPACLGTSRASIACTAATASICGPILRPVVTNFERLIESIRCAAPIAADIGAAVATGSPPTQCLVGWTRPALGTAEYKPSDSDNELFRSIMESKDKIAQNTNSTELMQAFSTLDKDTAATKLKDFLSSFMGNLIQDAEAAEKAEDELSTQYPVLSGIGIGVMGVGLLMGAILLAVNMQDMFFTNPKNRAIFYGVLAGLITVQTFLILGVVRPSIQEQAEKVGRIIDKLNGIGTPTNASSGVKPITSFPSEGFGLDGLDDDLGNNPDGPPLPCPNGGDGKGNCNPIGGVSESGLVNTPLAGMSGLLSNTAKLNNELAGKRSISKGALNAANELGRAAGKLKRVATLLKKQHSGLEQKLGLKPTDFNAASNALGRSMYSTAKNFLDSKGATAATFGAAGSAGISDKLKEQLSEEAKAGLASIAAPSSVAADPYAGMNFEEDKGATVDLGDSGATGMNDLDIKVDDITNDEHGNIFELLSMRYKKSAYPVLFEEVK